MANYISSNANRFYGAIENAYGRAAEIGSANRFPANRLEAHQTAELARRPDKTGTRTYLGQAGVAKLNTAFIVNSYLASWKGDGEPCYGPLFRAAMGGPVENQAAKAVANFTTGTNRLQMKAAYGFEVGSAVSFSGEIRFVTAVVDEYNYLLNAPFGRPPQAGDNLCPTYTYRLGPNQPSVTLYDFWDPVSALSRVITGAVVNRLRISVNGDYHEFAFSGPAADLLDSASFMDGQGGLASFPQEPARTLFDVTGVPGHLGQAWIGGSDSEFLTLTEAEIQINNNAGLRNQEFGSRVPRSFVSGPRDVSSTFTLLAQDDEQTLGLYASAKQRTSIQMMLQLGTQQGRLLGYFYRMWCPSCPSSTIPTRGCDGNSVTTLLKGQTTMKFTWLSRRQTNVQSVTWHESECFPGVTFALRQSSLAGRLDLMKAMRDLISTNEFLRSGDALDQTDAAISDLLARRLYLEWGAKSIEGLMIDGKRADIGRLIEKGPEDLCTEIVDRIREGLELSETERKNF